MASPFPGVTEDGDVEGMRAVRYEVSVVGGGEDDGARTCVMKC